MARVVVFVPDLLFGSRVIEAVRTAGHEPVPAADLEALASALDGAGAAIVDLTFDAGPRIEGISRMRGVAPPILAFYSHVDAAVREQAIAAGFDLVVPRSRMAREGAQLVTRLLGGATGASVE